MDDPSPQPSNLRPHVLCEELAQRLHPGARVLEVGSGRGRNTRALLARGFEVHAATDNEIYAFAVPPETFDAVLSTHGFLHGDESEIGRIVARAVEALRPDALFYAVFGSQRDARYGLGERISDRTWVPQSGEEAGIAHTYFTRSEVQALLEEFVVFEALDERAADAGAWAHAQPLEGHVHWFVRGRRR